jgi:hypothetical protein
VAWVFLRFGRSGQVRRTVFQEPDPLIRRLESADLIWGLQTPIILRAVAIGQSTAVLRLEAPSAWMSGILVAFLVYLLRLHSDELDTTIHLDGLVDFPDQLQCVDDLTDRPSVLMAVGQSSVRLAGAG